MTALHPYTAAPAALGRPSPTLTLQQSLSLGGELVFGFNRNLWLSGIPNIPTGKHTISARGSRPQGGEGDSGRADPQAPALTSRLPTCVSPSPKPSKEASLLGLSQASARSPGSVYTVTPGLHQDLSMNLIHTKICTIERLRTVYSQLRLPSGPGLLPRFGLV